MAKKYVPSGYQIINIDSTNIDGNEYLVETEDVKILKDVLKNKKFNKPILLHDFGSELTGFLTLFGNTCILIGSISVADVSIDGIYAIKISYQDVDDKLLCETQEI